MGGRLRGGVVAASTNWFRFFLISWPSNLAPCFIHARSVFSSDSSIFPPPLGISPLSMTWISRASSGIPYASMVLLSSASKVAALKSPRFRLTWHSPHLVTRIGATDFVKLTSSASPMVGAGSGSSSVIFSPTSDSN